MVSFTLHLIGVILCVLFRFFVAVGICHGIYSLFKNIKEKISIEIADRRWRNRIKQKEEQERLSQMTEEQIKEEKQINGEIKFAILACGVILTLVILIVLINKY